MLEFSEVDSIVSVLFSLNWSLFSVTQSFISDMQVWRASLVST